MTTREKRVEYYDDEAGEVRWRVRNENNRITGKSEEGFKKLREAMDNYEESLRAAAVVVNHSKQGKGRKHDREEGQLASNAGSAGEEGPDTNSGEAGTHGLEGGVSSPDDSDPEPRVGEAEGDVAPEE